MLVQKEQVDWKINSMCDCMVVKLIITVVVVTHSNAHWCFGYWHGAYMYKHHISHVLQSMYTLAYFTYKHDFGVN